MKLGFGINWICCPTLTCPPPSPAHVGLNSGVTYAAVVTATRADKKNAPPTISSLIGSIQRFGLDREFGNFLMAITSVW